MSDQSDQFDRIPVILRNYSQWVVWRREHRDGSKPAKVLYNVSNGKRASVSDPSSWTTFAQAVAQTRSTSQYDGIGFVFTRDDPFCGIDLDIVAGQKANDFQTFALEILDSYSETSPGGHGVHIIIKGAVPYGRNNQKLGIEIYSQGRYFTFTGNRTSSSDKDIEDRQRAVLQLWQEIGGVFDEDDDFKDGKQKSRKGNAYKGKKYKIKCPAIIDDAKLLKRICASKKNHAYFNWTSDFNWSEAYRSILSAACLFSSDENQIKRIILNSPLVTKAPPHGHETRPDRVARLWAREYQYASTQGDQERIDLPYRIWSTQWFPQGSKDQYNKSIDAAKEIASGIIQGHAQKIFKQAKRVRLKQVTNQDQSKLPIPLMIAGLIKASDLHIKPPPGIFAELINEICARTRNPSNIMAIWATLGFISGAIGRSYLTNEGAGVNCFYILSAGTNTGKTQHWNALESIVRIAAPKLLGRIFGGAAASPQIIAEEGQRLPSMVLRLPDHGSWLKSIVAANTQAQANIRESLLSIYESANEGASWHIPKSIRVKKDNSRSIAEFNMSLVLDTTPQYISEFELSDFTDGLISRFIIITGPEVLSDRQKPKSSNALSQSIRAAFGNLLTLSIAHSRPTNIDEINQNPAIIPKRIVIRYAENLSDYIDNLEDELVDIVQDIQRGRMPQHYIAISRVVLNAKRIASIIAILESPASPVITKDILNWALRFALLSVTKIIQMFDVGMIGSDETKQEAAIIDFIERQDKPYVTLRQIGQHVDRLTCFSRSKWGARLTRKRALEDLIERGILERVTIQTRTKPIQAITLANVHRPFSTEEGEE